MEYLQKFMAAPIAGLQDYVLPFIGVLGVLVFVHEWGHYIVARMCGVKVIKFSIGFGREIFGWTDKKGTRWKISWLPLGGYVQMFGDVDPASAQHAEGVKEGDKIRPYTEQEKKEAFYTQHVFKRCAIVAAGPGINYLLAVVIMAAVFSTAGQPTIPPIAAAVVEGSVAEKAGILPDDKIIEADGKTIKKFQDITPIVAVNLDKEMEIKILRSTGKGQWSDTPITLRVTPARIEQTDRFGFKHEIGRIGISSPKDAFEMEKHTPGSAVMAAVAETWSISASTLKAMGQIVLGTRSKDELGGVLRIGAYAGEFAKQGWVSLLTFAALLSVNLGLLNILPIPMLDGGHLAFYAAEIVKGKPISDRAQEYALRIGMTFLVATMMLSTWNDLVQMKVLDYLLDLVS